jgi:hypothetical protein
MTNFAKTRGTLGISRLIDLRKCKSVNHALGSVRFAVPQLLPHSLVELGKCEILAAVC